MSDSIGEVTHDERFKLHLFKRYGNDLFYLFGLNSGIFMIFLTLVIVVSLSISYQNKITITPIVENEIIPGIILKNGETV